VEIAAGVSMVSADARWTYKFSGSANSRGDVGATAGVGFQW
jgi:autotransporter adhesin